MGGNAKRVDTNLNENPGPGTYKSKYTVTKPKSRLSSMGAKNKPRKYKNGQQVPSPVTYDPIIAFNKLKCKSTGKMSKTGIGFARSGRTKTRKSYFLGPGNHQVRKKIGGPAFG